MNKYPIAITREKPILFSTEMVKAILEGRKTQTRRVIKQGSKGNSYDYFARHAKSPYGQSGDRLWVRESWADGTDALTNKTAAIYKATHGLLPGQKWNPSIFMPRKYSRITLEITAIKAQRVQEITEEDAKDEGCQAVKWGIWWQGYKKVPLGGGMELLHTNYQGEQPPDWMIEPHEMRDRPWMDVKAVGEYKILWDKINGNKYPWVSNPWVWAITFKVIK